MDIINGAIFVSAVLNLFAAAVIFYYGKKNAGNISFVAFVVSVFLWAMAIFFYRGAAEDTIYFWTKSLYLSPLLIVLSFVIFSLYFAFELQKIKRIIIAVTVASFVPLAFLTIVGKSIIQDVQISTVRGVENILTFGDLYTAYGAFIIIFFALSFFILFHKYRTSKEPLRRQVLLVFGGTLLPVIVGVITNLILPTLGIFHLNWFGQAFSISMVSVIAFAIANHNFLNIKLFSVQVIIFAINAVTFIEIFSSTTVREYILRSIFFVVITLLMYAFLRSVRKEITQKEELEKVTAKLSRANTELKKLDNAKSEFISIASHQLRTPLTAIKGYLSLIKEGLYGPMPEKMEGAYDKIYTANERLIQLVEDLLNISRIESGRMEYHFERVNMSTVVTGLYDTFVLRTQKEGLEFKIVFDEKIKYMVNADPGKIQQVVSNLIDNAIKYTEDGWVQVKLVIENDNVIVRVEDSGIGIPEEIMKSLFQKFSRGKDRARLHVEGTGLGLYVGRSIVEQHQGRILVESEGTGKGAIFTLELPYIKE